VKTFNVLMVIALVVGMASTVAANAQLKSAMHVRSAVNWQYAAQAAWVSSQVYDSQLSRIGHF
jgi:hypothetical protein